MLHSTRGIVLKTFKYSENAVIAKIFTEKFGLRSYIIKGISGKKRQGKKPLLQTLSLLNLIVYEKNSANLQNIKEIESAHTYSSIPFDIAKSTIIMFLNEVIYKSIVEEEPNVAMFDFIFDQMIALDGADENIADFHTFFLINFSGFLGFMPHNSYSGQNQYFDLQEGCFVEQKPIHRNFMDSGLSEKFNQILCRNDQKLFSQSVQRNELLEKIIQYYSLHVPAFGELKSFSILKQVLS
jgi:DNA repair protein RecO (recombination protein O)